MRQPADSHETQRGHRITLRVPEILLKRLTAQVSLKQAEFSRFSMNDWIIAAIREKLDGPQQQQTAAAFNNAASPAFNGHSSSPPIQPGLQVSDSFWPAWARRSKTLDPDAREESFREALRERQAIGLALPPKWGKWNPEAKMAWLRLNDQL